MPAETIDAAEYEPRPQLLDPEGLPDHIDALYRAARAMCGSRYDAEDLVQETLEIVLRPPLDSTGQRARLSAPGAET